MLSVELPGTFAAKGHSMCRVRIVHWMLLASSRYANTSACTCRHLERAAVAENVISKMDVTCPGPKTK